MKIETILFDLDGTLLKSTDMILEAFRLTFDAHLPDHGLSESDFTSFLGQTLWTTFGQFTGDSASVDAMVKTYRKISDDLMEDNLEAYPKAEETIRYLMSKGINIGVVTSKMRALASVHLKRIGLYDHIRHIVGYEDVTKHKPDPEPILTALSLFGTKGERTLYVGDHENDIISARKAGVLTCAVTYSHRLAEMLAYNPDFVIDELVNLKDIV
jgi:HAD superfamily hydrolase (TIGR01509 family)